MTIRQKTIAAFAFAFLLLMAGGYWVTGKVLRDASGELERESALRDLQRARELMLEELEAMTRTSEDWSDWDDAYLFMGGENRQFLADNLMDTTFSNLRLNVMLFLAPNGAIHHGRWFDLEQGREVGAPSGAHELLLNDGFLKQAAAEERILSGIIPLPGMPPLLAVFHPIRTSEGKGPARGGLLMGRFLDPATVSLLEKRALVDLEVMGLEAGDLPPDFARAHSAYRGGELPLLEAVDESTLAAFTTYTGLGGRPSVLLRVHLPRDIHRAMLAARSRLLLGLGAVGVLISLVALLLSSYLVLTNIYRLHRQVKEIGADRDITRRVELPGNDEIAGLGRAVNGMLEALDSSERALRRSEESLSVTLRSIADGVVTIDLKGQVLLMNHAAESLTGWTKEEAAGTPLAEVFALRHPHSGVPALLPVEEVLRRGQAAGLPPDCALTLRGGGEAEVSGSLAPMKNGEGRVVGAVLVIHDLTGEKAYEEEILKARKLESITLLAGGLAHDFTQSLTGVLTNLAAARSVLKPEDKAYRFLDEGEKAAQHARALAGRLLAFSPGGQGERRRVELGTLLRESLRQATADTGTVTAISVPSSLWPVEVDEAQMGQVFHHLARNAAEAMPGGGVLTVTGENVSLDAFNSCALPPGRYVQLTFEDEGEGIPEEALPRVFDPFFTTREKANGLGLPTVFAILLRHQGRVTVRSAPGGGAAFTLYLPAARP